LEKKRARRRTAQQKRKKGTQVDDAEEEEEVGEYKENKNKTKKRNSEKDYERLSRKGKPLNLPLKRTQKTKMPFEM